MNKSIITCVVLPLGALIVAALSAAVTTSFSDGARPAQAAYHAATLVHTDQSGASPVAKRLDGAIATVAPVAAAAPIRFAAIDIIIDTKVQPLAVYQLEFSAEMPAAPGAAGGAASSGPALAAPVAREAAAAPRVTIVGIEGGEHEAFRAAPHYDPAAIQQERVIIGAFNTAEADKLPRGKVKVATIHVQVTGAPGVPGGPGAPGDDEKSPPPLPKFNVKLTVSATVDGKPIDATATTQVKGTQL